MISVIFFHDDGPILSESIHPSCISFILEEKTLFLLVRLCSKESKSRIGKDNISMKLLKEIIPINIETTIHLFNLSLKLTPMITIKEQNYAKVMMG